MIALFDYTMAELEESLQPLPEQQDEKTIYALIVKFSEISNSLGESFDADRFNFIYETIINNIDTVVLNTSMQGSFFHLVHSILKKPKISQVHVTSCFHKFIVEFLVSIS